MNCRIFFTSILKWQKKIRFFVPKVKNWSKLPFFQSFVSSILNQKSKFLAQKFNYLIFFEITYSRKSSNFGVKIQINPQIRFIKIKFFDWKCWPSVWIMTTSLSSIIQFLEILATMFAKSAVHHWTEFSNLLLMMQCVFWTLL